MSTKFKVFREFTSDDSFLNQVIPENITEFQVTLSLARDYDGNNSTNGKFIPYWDTEKVTPEVIKKFKKKYEPTALRVKVLVSIGNKNKQFPFTIGSDSNSEAWVSEATASLKSIIKTYNLDGIDVSYEDIAANEADFVNSVGGLVRNLKQNKLITVASFATSADAANNKFYNLLYAEYATFFDTVVFLSWVGFTPSRANPVASLEEKILAVANEYKAVKAFLVAYSTVAEDWANFSPPIFFITLHGLLGNSAVKGASIKVISDATASFPAKWIPEILLLAASK
ncbi:hypothetical protein AAZX31_01G130400 [Glycine max]|uniref:RuBisCO-associated protein n=3 Tax=Glycine subgen. Soja TaxID=1462606 RepID=RUAP_SOYBN|nr:ruBisCO-associated protein [Glycine max]XP_028238546.1 ruBisCO-associated protein [Glycine soja]P39657.1 RecName: Full=RuBisCO-associated protein [Glycine max]AAA34007.1 putative [Glycine max]KAG5060729.1 hypothetical protein JHK87_001758 [Glycine soja]KAG5069440.1 hypothetical protein JHK85_001817 [Glycine max]KAG5089157.1 hypothetical protein JHK86_001769 [Glycine max]KAH1163053.1 hypothetical protein GYH30_001546 [Glycine max]|eukprot:NP_001236757.1 ruBisCO-associated protein [Glycine max]